VLRFSSPRRVLEHLRNTGANGLERAGWTRGALRAFEKEYRERFSADVDVTLTYHPMFFFFFFGNGSFLNRPVS